MAWWVFCKDFVRSRSRPQYSLDDTKTEGGGVPAQWTSQQRSSHVDDILQKPVVNFITAKNCSKVDFAYYSEYFATAGWIQMNLHSFKYHVQAFQRSYCAIACDSTLAVFRCFLLGFWRSLDHKHLADEPEFLARRNTIIRSFVMRYDLNTFAKVWSETRWPKLNIECCKT